MTLPSDPRFADQWHLRNTAPGQFDLNVRWAWDAGITGAGVRAFVLDDGFDVAHADIAPNYVRAGQIDYEQGDFNPVPRFAADNHGTAVMGLLGAARNGVGAVGVAYGVDLTGIRGYSDDRASAGTMNDYITDIGRGITRAAAQGGDLLSMSNGYASGNAYFGSGLSAAAIDAAVAAVGAAAATGRGGLGLVIVKAAGNSRTEGWNTNMSEVDTDPRLVSVAAVDRFGAVDDYSSYGGNILVSGFGSPGQVVTTDRTGAPGYTPTNITTTFDGTSAATPMVAGVVALILDANEALGWRDVQAILAASARITGSGTGGDGATPTGFERDVWTANRSEQWNGGGFMFSNDYGFGLVDASAAVRLAQTWFTGGGSAGTTASQEVLTRDLLNAPRRIPDDTPRGVAVSTSIGAAGENFQIDYTTVTITMSPRHTFMGDLVILLENGAGDVAVLHNREGGGTNFPGTWTFTTRQFQGEDAQGTWTLRVIDAAGGDTGRLTDVVIRQWGDANTVDDRLVVTDQFGLFAGESGRRLIEDTNGGRDTLNAAALSQGATIILDAAATSRIDGVNARVAASIENVIGGAGSDRITGSAAANLLQGRDGNDSLFGAAGADDLRGSNGADRIDGGTGRDVLTGGGGPDSFVFTAAPGAANADRITDFDPAGDLIRLDDADFTGLALGTLRIAQFVANAAGQATQAAQRIIQDTDSGALYFDRDGSGSAARRIFAVIDTGTLVLDRFDFVIF